MTVQKKTTACESIAVAGALLEAALPEGAITLEIPLPADLDGLDDDVDLPETDDEAYEHVPQPAAVEQGLKDGTPTGEDVTIVSDDETHHYAIARWKGHEVRERIALHVFKLPPGKQLQELNDIARRLRARLCKKFGLAGGPGNGAAIEAQRRRRGRQLARKEMKEMLRERIQKLIKHAEAASQPFAAWKNAEAFAKALGLREACGLMLNQDPATLPRPSRWLDDGADLVELAKELGVKMAEEQAALEAPPPAEPAPEWPKPDEGAELLDGTPSEAQVALAAPPAPKKKKAAKPKPDKKRAKPGKKPGKAKAKKR